MVEADSDTSASSGTDSGTSNAASSSQSSKGGYPAVDKWESGITRGPANPIGITKWSDVVGAKLTRGHANPLNEQDAITNAVMGYAINDALKNDTPYIEVPAFFGGNIRIPKDSEGTIKYFKGDENLVVRFADKQRGANGELLWAGEPAPAEVDLKEILPINTLRSFKTKKDGYFYSVILQKNDGAWTANKNYYATVGSKYIPYNPKNYINYSTSTNVLEFLDEHGELILQICGSLLAAFITAGESLFIQCIAQAAVQIPFSIKDALEGKKVGAVISFALCFLPYAGKAARFIGTKFNRQILNSLSKELSVCKSIDEIKAVINNAKIAGKLDKDTELILSRLIKQTPEELGKIIGTPIIEGFKKGVKNGSIVLSKIPSGQLLWWKKALLEGGSGLSLMVGSAYANSLVLTPEKRNELEKSVAQMINAKQTSDKDTEDEIAKQNSGYYDFKPAPSTIR